MKKTLILALALTSVSLAGCTDDTAEAPPADTTVIETPMETPMTDTTVVMTDTTGGMMEGSDTMAPADGSMEAAPADTTTSM